MPPCGALRRSLQALHDGELEARDQIAASAHVEMCHACAEVLADLQEVSRVLRQTASDRSLSYDELAGFREGVVARLKAEREASLLARVRNMFEDMHLVYAGLGGTVAMMLTVATMFGVLHFVGNERPDSLAAVVAFLATPGSRADAVLVDVASHARWAARFSAANEAAEQDAVFALAATLTRGGGNAAESRPTASQTLARPTEEDRKAIDGLLDAVARARLGPKQAEGLPAIGNMVVWLVTHTTVRASRNPTAGGLPLPAVKKRA